MTEIEKKTEKEEAGERSFGCRTVSIKPDRLDAEDLLGFVADWAVARRLVVVCTDRVGVAVHRKPNRVRSTQAGS